MEIFFRSVSSLSYCPPEDVDFLAGFSAARRLFVLSGSLFLIKLMKWGTIFSGYASIKYRAL